MRILVINGAVSGVESAPGEEWSDLIGYAHKGNLWAAIHHDLVDYDVFIADPEKLSEREDAQNTRLVGPQIAERVEGGGCLICFASTKNLSWLPVQFQPRQMSGQRITIEDGPERLKALLEKYQAEMSYRAQFVEQQGWQPLARGLNSYPVAGHASHGKGAVLMLPEFKNRAKVIREVLDRVIPAMVPGLRREPSPTLSEEAPDWLVEFPIPKAEEVSQQVNALEEKISRLRQDLGEKERELRGLLEYQGLLWLEGKALEAIVEKALNLLGVPAHPKGQIDLACALPSGGELYIEVEGTAGAVQIRKGRQLLGYIAEADDPAKTLGAIIGNPYRKEHPSDRPPPGSQVGLFSPQLEGLAAKQKWPLVPATRLFDWVCRHLNGDKDAAREAKSTLGLE